MKWFSRLGDRMLDRLVPEVEAGACKERLECERGFKKRRCYYGCGGPAFCVTASGYC